MISEGDVSDPFDPRFARFLAGADSNALRSWLEDHRMIHHLRMLDDLEPLFFALRHGEEPRYEDIDWSALRADSTELSDIHRWICMSNKADMQVMACELAERVKLAALTDNVEPLLHARDTWLASRALQTFERVGSRDALAVVRSLVLYDPDLSRQAADAVERMTQALEGGGR